MSTPENSPESGTSIPPATAPAVEADETEGTEGAEGTEPTTPAAADPALADAIRSIRGVGENLRGEE